MNGNGSNNITEAARRALYAGARLLAAVLVLAGSLAVAAFVTGALYAYARVFFIGGCRLLTP
ncbi:MAG: hypothetical protein RMK20_16135 [Verrucomicrobiales bacterium]|nr:hypothetical protein [Verrucomicrobiales bacterium]